MKCVKCGHEIEKGVIFCPYCGKKVGGTETEEEKPVYVAEVKGLLKSGKLAVYHDRAEFVTSNVQKTVFDYSALVSVKKGLDRILFITEDGRTESCVVNRKNIHEAFIYIEKTSEPYIAERKKRLLSEGVRYSFVSSQGLTGGILNILDDMAEFKSKSGQSETVSFCDVKSVGLSMGMLEFLLIDRKTKSFGIDKEIRDEVISFLKKAIEPYIQERKEALLAKGIYYSFPSSYGPDSGTLDILEDRAEYTFGSGKTEPVFFQDVLKADIFSGRLEFSLADGRTRSFGVDQDVCEEVLSFITNAIQPFVMKRTVGFDTAFGIDERIEINEERGVFHIVRQSGNEITEEYPLEDLAACTQTEKSMSDSVLGSVLSGGIAIFNTASEMAGAKKTSGGDDRIRHSGVVLTIREGGELRTESIWFGEFPLGISRTNKKYEKYSAEIREFMDYLSRICPDCERIVPAPLEDVCENAETEENAAGRKKEDTEEADSAGTAGTANAAGSAGTAGAVPEKDPFGIKRYLAGVSGFIGQCATPMTIAIQGSWGSGKNSIMRLLYDNLKERYEENRIWFNTWQFSQFNSKEQLPFAVGKGLISQLNGAENTDLKGTAIKVAKGLINITSGFISQGSTDGQNITDALFKDNAIDSLEKAAKGFAEQIKKRTGGEENKVIFFIDDLDRLEPGRAVELLEAMKNFYAYEGCVFVIAVNYDFIISGIQKRYGQEFSEEKGKRFFDKIFQVSFRVPVSGCHVDDYVKDKLKQTGIHTDDEAELKLYTGLTERSAGTDPKNMDRLFDSFLLIKNMADEELDRSKEKRLMLFALLCMQMKFHGIYDSILERKDKLTPDFLMELCRGESELMADWQISDDERTQFPAFAEIFSCVIDTDSQGGISRQECEAFAEVLDFSVITSK